MTARSGDALLHVNFQARPDVVVDGERLPRIRLDAPHPNIALGRGRISSARICIAGMSGASRNEPGFFVSFEHYLNKSSPQQGLQYWQVIISIELVKILLTPKITEYRLIS
jgi:hypothetical protein